MDELINLVSQRTGLPPDKARLAVETVFEHIKGRLPAPIASQLDAMLQGNLGAASTGGTTGGMGALASELGGLFGGKK
jgi:hypothetical protein